MPSTLRSIGLLLAAAALVAACSTTGGGASPSAAAPTTAPSEAAPSEPAASADTGGGVGLAAADSSLGQIVVDDAGVTLYAFTPDEGGAPTCYDQCAAAWPPLTADDPASATVGTGLDAALLTSVDRTDGSKQLVYDGWPLYYFANDAAAGDTNGQGLNDKWYVIAPDGTLIK
jgi:predicted lipoprotein with Yx(FWY)xxD motif